MLKALFGEVKTGRLLRLPYLGYSLLLSVLMIGIGLAFALAIGVGEHIIGGDLEAAQEVMRENFSLPLLLLFLVVSILFLFGGGNIMAKRIRDIGLPGWWTVLAILIILGIVGATISENASNALQTLFWVVLLLVPSNVLARGDGIANSA